MADYYRIHKGDLYPGHIAKSSDINIIQQITKDAIKTAINDLTEGQSWILGTNDQSDQNAFILTPDAKKAGRYIDQMNLAEGEDIDFVSIREIDYRQPIKLSRSSLYSVIVKMQNKSEKDVNVNFELRDGNGNLIPKMRTILNLPAHTNTPAEFEVVFDLKYYPTAHGFDPEDLQKDDSSLVILNTDEQSFEYGPDYQNEENLNSFSAGASVIYLYIEALNKNKEKAFDVNTEEDDGYMWNDSDPTFGLVINKNSTYGQLLEEDTGSGFVLSSKRGDLYFKEIYANGPTYKCEMGQAIINGGKVILADTHVTIGANISNPSNSFGNIRSYVYMDEQGHLKAVNSEPFLGSEPAIPIFVTEPHLHIANITTFFDRQEPLVEQDDENQITRPRSHHERLRRLEKKTKYVEDIAIPPRFKFTLTEDDWIDENPNTDLTLRTFNGYEAQSIDSLDKSGYVLTTDKNGNFIVKVSESELFNVDVTLKSEDSGKVTTENNDTKIISTAQTAEYINALKKDDLKRATIFAEIKNAQNDITKGTLTLENTNSGITIAKTDEEAKKTEFNPWDDSQENRPATSDVKPTTRTYTIESGKNGANDWASEFPAMTFYTDIEYKLKKLQIPIYKFQNCTGIKFIIWERQGPNDKQNTVWFKKRIYTSKTFSLENAKTKDGYQFMDDGFIIDFGEDGLTLTKGQYVIVCFPIVESGTGSVFVDTYKPANSKDFCIRYYGAANGSHFLLKERYHEIWYNPIKAQAEEVSYSKEGSVVSAAISWENKEPIKSVKPIINSTIPKETSIEIYVDVGGGWKKVTANQDNSVIGSGSGETFKWKIVLKGNSKDTPIISYDEKKKYAISFEITRAEPSTSKMQEAHALDKNLCLTSKVFDANDILRKYIGDMNFALQDNKFSNYEFARIWGTDSDDGNLLIDIAASDRVEPVKDANGSNLTSEGKQIYYPIYSLHYVDLSLADIPQVSVDYHNYDPFLEEDEHNLRLKLDTENSYNDNDIKVVDINDFVLENASYATEEEDGLGINLSSIVPTEKNQVIAKAKFQNPIDLSKYAALKVGLTLNGTEEGTFSGLAFYISSQYETDVPTNIDDEEILGALPDGLPDLNNSQEEIIEQYANKVIYDIVNYNGTAVKVYYKSVWNSLEGKWEWQLLNNTKSFNIYEVINRQTKDNVITITEENNGVEQFFELEIDTNSINLQYAKEIGIIILNDEGKYEANNVDTLIISDFKAIKKDYYKAFEAAESNVFTSFDPERTPVVCLPSGKLDIPKSDNTTNKYTKTIPETSSIKITHQDVKSTGEYLCTFNMTSKSTKDFRHIGIQLASDCLLTKYMLELHLIQIDKYGNKKTIEKIRIPTINHIFYPTSAGNSVNLSQIFKKIKTTERFDEIALYATNKFKTYAGKLKNVTTESPKGALGETITLYVGNIILYKATSIPILYPMMRMKFYLDEIDSISRDKVGIRKIGTVIQYQ